MRQHLSMSCGGLTGRRRAYDLRRAPAASSGNSCLDVTLVRQAAPRRVVRHTQSRSLPRIHEIENLQRCLLDIGVGALVAPRHAQPPERLLRRLEQALAPAVPGTRPRFLLTQRAPLEVCGDSAHEVLVEGGLRLSTS